MEREGIYSSDSAGAISCRSCGYVNPADGTVCERCGEEIRKVEASYRPGDLIQGKFEVVSVLGSTAMGEVYKVRHEALDVLRCIKVLRKSLLEDEVFKADFLREARLATRAHHPSIALVHDIDVADDGRYYVVWEFVDGITIRQWGMRHGACPYPLAVQLAHQALAGLGHIHSKGILHHHLSDDNLMVTLDFDQRPAMKITDLGVGRVIGGSGDKSGEATTQVGMFLGNPKYSSPEQLGMLGDKETIDARSDLYCLAVVLYEMIAGAPPFSSPTPQGFLVKHLTEPPPPFSSVAPEVDVPSGLQGVVLRALQKNRNHRYENAAEFAKALEPYLDFDDVSQDRFAEMIRGDLPSNQKVVTSTIEMPAAVETEEIDDRATKIAPMPSLPEIESRATVELAPTMRGDLAIPSEEESAAVGGAPAPDALAEIEAAEKAGDLDQLNAIAARLTLGTPMSDSVREAIDAVESRLAEERGRAEAEEWDRAVEAGTSDAWVEYLKTHPESGRAKEATENRNEARMFEAARDAGELSEWESFLSMYPDAAHASEARSLRDALAKEIEEAREREKADWSQAVEARTSVAWTRYLDAHPESERASEAKSNRGEAAAFEAARESNRMDDWDAYLAAHPDGAHRADAQERRDTLAREIEEAREKEDADWNRAAGAGTAGEWARYLDAHPESERASEARSNRDEAAAFESASGSSTIEGWDDYLDRWPEGAHREAATSLRDALAQRLEEERLERERQAEEAAWSRAAEAGSSEVWERYLEAHPASERVGEARTNRDEAAAFESARDADVPESWNSYLEAWPEGVHRPEAETLRDDLVRRIEEEKERLERERQAEEAAWSQAERAGTKASWNEYLEAHPASERLEDATARRDEAAAFEDVLADESLDGWASFLARFPEGPHAERAERQRSALENRLEEERRRQEKIAEAEDWQKATDLGTSAAWREYIEAHPDSNRAEQAFTNRDEAWAFESASAGDRLDDWNRFLDVWPRGTHRDEAARRRDALAHRLEEERRRQERIAEAADWDRAMKSATSEVWASYLAAHPGSDRIDEARERKREAEQFEAAEEANDLGEWNEYLSAWPDGPHYDKALGIRDALAATLAREREQAERERIAEASDWLNAEHAGTSAAWGAYLEAHPGSNRAAHAKSNLEEVMAYEAALQADDLKAWKEFVASWPNGRHATEATLRRDALEREHETQNREKEQKAWDRAMELNTASAWEGYLAEYGDSERAAKARDYHDEAVDFIGARIAGTIEAWKKFLSVWPEGRYADQAVAAAREAEQRIADELQRAENAAWERALGAATRHAWDDYLERFPDSDRAAQAAELREQASDFDAASRAGTLDGWAEFLEKFSGGPYVDQARERLAELREREQKAEFRRAMRPGTTEALEAYLETAGDSPYAAMAREALDELRAYETVAGSDSEEEWSAFLEKWPRGPHADEARDRVQAIRAAAEPEPAPEPVEPEAPLPSARKRWVGLAITAAVVIVVIVGALLAFRSSSVRGLFMKAPTLSVDALPWARVISVRDASGKDRLPSGPQYTPFAMHLPKGDYDVVLEYGSPSAESRTIRVHISGDGVAHVTEYFAPVEAGAFFEETGW